MRACVRFKENDSLEEKLFATCHDRHAALAAKLGSLEGITSLLKESPPCLTSSQGPKSHGRPNRDPGDINTAFDSMETPSKSFVSLIFEVLPPKSVGCKWEKIIC